MTPRLLSSEELDDAGKTAATLGEFPPGGWPRLVHSLLAHITALDEIAAKSVGSELRWTLFLLSRLREKNGNNTAATLDELEFRLREQAEGPAKFRPDPDSLHAIVMEENDG